MADNTRSPRLGELAERYIDGKPQQPGVRAIRSTLVRFIGSASDRPVGTLPRHHVERWLWEAEGVAPRTLATRLKTLRAWCNWMVAEGYLPENPTTGLRVAGVPGRRRLRQPRPGPTEEATELLRAFEHDQLRRGLSERTLSGRRRTLNSFAIHAEPAGLLEASRQDIGGFLDGCAIGVRSRHTYIASLRAFYHWAEREGLRADDPTRRIALPRQSRLVPHPIADDDLAVAVKGSDARTKAWLLLRAFEGLRCKEMAGLRAEDLFADRDPPMLRDPPRRAAGSGFFRCTRT